MKAKLGAAFLAVSMMLAATTGGSLTYAAPSAKVQAAYSAQASFAKQFGLDAKSISSAMFYDVNNDKSEEIILSAPSKDGYGPWVSYIGIYSKNGTKLLARNVESEGFYSIRRIKNKTYKNMLALVHNGGSGGASVSVNTFNNGALKEIYATDVLITDEPVIKDADQDGSDEILGYQLYYAQETRSLSNADGIYDKLVYKWDASKKKYAKIVYGQDGVRDSQRAKVGTITKAEALSLLQKARSKQMSLDPDASLNNVTKQLQSTLTYNFLSEIGAAGWFDVRMGYVEVQYTGNAYNLQMVPAFTPQKAATFKLSSDKESATVTQTLYVSDEEGEYASIVFQATLFKTKYGWKVEKVLAFD